MEEMNKELMDNTVTEIVEEAADKLTFKENLMAYGLASVFAVGVVTTGYFAYKGVRALSNKVRNNVKGKMEEQTEQEEVVDIDENDIQETDNDTDN
jgi:predicted polyphosphate/ATP-dependent NAD kinase